MHVYSSLQFNYGWNKAKMTIKKKKRKENSKPKGIPII